MKILLAIATALVLSMGFGQSPESGDTATTYLNALTFKDYSRMYDLTADKAGISRQEFYAAAEALAGSSGEPQILSRSRQGDRTTVYFEIKPPNNAPAVRGSIVVRPDGIEHPQLLAHLQRTPPTGAATAQQPAGDVTIAGETVQSVLTKMTSASEAAKTMKAVVAIRGSMMGQTMNEVGNLAYKAPDKFRMDFKTFVMNSDGANNVLYMPGANMLMRLDQLGQFELSPGIGTSGAELREKYDVKLVSKQEVGGRPAFELSLTPPQSGLSSLVGSGKMRLWIDALTWLPLRAAMSSMTVDYQSIQVNTPDVTDQTFVFTAPAGAQELSLGGLLGSMGGTGMGQLPAQ